MPRFVKGSPITSAAILTVATALASLLLSQRDFFLSVELSLYDRLFQVRGPLPVESPDIALVVIDEQTADSLSFPFDRKHYAMLVTKLNRLGARMVAFDVGFSSEGARPESDSLFKATIHEAGNVVLCSKTDQVSHRRLRERIVSLKPPHSSIMPPGTPWGLIDEIPDDDGFTRRYLLYNVVRDTAFLSFGLKIYALDRGIDLARQHFPRRGDFVFGDRTIPRIDINTCLVNFSGPARTFPTYSFYDVIRGNYDFDDLLSGLSPEEAEALQASGMADLLQASPFKDKIVLVGASAEDLQDNKLTPAFTAGTNYRMPGVEVHANALKMLQDGTFIRPVDLLWTLLGMLFLALLISVVGHRLPAGWSALIAILAIGGILVLGGYLFVERGLWLRQVPLLLAVITGYPANLVWRFIQTQREKALYRGMFSQYVQKEVVDELIKHPENLKLGGERRRMSVLFTDVAGFSTISERLSPEDLVHLLNEYLSAMSRKIVEHGGIIDKYEGDLIMAEFGAPIWASDHAARSCRAGLQMQQLLTELRLKWQSEGRIPLYSRVGINTGDMLVGNMGSDTVFDYTVMGDAVNLASRLEGANKAYGTTIMIGQGTWEEVKGSFVTRPLDLLRVKGKNEPVAVYELLAESRGEVSEAKLQALELFSTGLAHYQSRRFAEALALFEQALAADSKDEPSRTYIGRCRFFIAEPPGEDWDGVWTLTEK